MSDLKPGDTAFLCLDGWAGRREYRVEILGRNSTGFKFRALEDIAMPRRRHVIAGETATAPLYAFRKAAP